SRTDLAVRRAATTPAPVAPTSRIGREHEIADIRAALEHHRIVTLIGPGGVGKSRLAAEVTAQLSAEAAMDAAWVELGAVTDPQAIDHVVATAAGIDLGGGPPPRRGLLEALANRQLLLVLDNTEHLLDTVAPLVEEVQRTAPQVRVLATGRARLAVVGERVLPIEPLSTSTDDDSGTPSDAARLFLERASEASMRSSLTEPLPLVTAICRELDGLPLAIELAAARTAALSLEDLLTALRDAPATAAGHRRGHTPRHRDLWAVVDWSWRLLAEDEQQLFARLGIFAGTFGVDEAHAVAAPEGWDRTRTLEQLATLSERSLLARPTTGPDGERARYRLLRPLRAFARQRLADRAELEELSDHHARVLTERAERAAGPPLSDPGRRWLEASLDDLREARRHVAAKVDVELLGRLVAALYRFDYWRPGSELHGWAVDALTLEGIEQQPTAPQVHAAAATAAWRRGDLDDARRLATLGTQLGSGPDDPARTVAFEALGDAANFAGALTDACTAYREEERLARLAEDPDSETLAVSSAALVLAYDGRTAVAIDEAGRALRLADRAGPATQAFARYAYGECLAERDPDRAIELVAQAADLAHDARAWFVHGVAQLTLASLRARHHEPGDTLPLFADLLEHWHRSGSWTQQWTTLRNLVDLLVRLGADEDAALIAAAIEAQPSASTAFGAESDRLARALADVRHRLGDVRFAAAYERGTRLTAAEVVEVARARVDELRS
ncbi:MAG: ATP-binding protein, partial [Actinomycetota bacterium]